MDRLWQDVRYGAKMIARNPAVSAVALVALALGIGIASSIFSFVDTVLLKPLAFRDGDRLVSIWDNWPRCTRCPPSPPTFIEWKTLNTVFSDVAAYEGYTESFNLTGRDQAEQLVAREVSANYFDMLGVQPLLGRTFRAEEEQYGNEHVVMQSHQLWQRRFGSDPKIVGESLALNQKLYTVVGVLPPHPIFDQMANDLWAPLAIPPDRMRRTTQYFGARAKLKPGVTVAQANAEMARLAASIASSDPAMKDHNFTVEPLRDSLVREDLRGTLWLLLGARVKTMTDVVSDSTVEPRFRTFLFFIFGGLALLLAAVGIYGVVSYSATQRSHEMGIRIALGAKRADIFKLIVGHGLILTSIGLIIGVGGAFWLTRFLASLLFQLSASDAGTCVISCAAMLSVAAFACSAPARRATKVDPLIALRCE